MAPNGSGPDPMSGETGGEGVEFYDIENYSHNHALRGARGDRMIVCSCRGVFERTVNRAIDQGALTVDEVGRACGAGTDCGSCQDTIEDLIASRMLVRHASPPANDTAERRVEERRAAH